MSKVTLMPENKIGLYDPSLEKDACGVGFIVSIEREETNKVLTDAKTMLIRMAHRYIYIKIKTKLFFFFLFVLNYLFTFIEVHVVVITILVMVLEYSHQCHTISFPKYSSLYY